MRRRFAAADRNQRRRLLIIAFSIPTAKTISLEMAGAVFTKADQKHVILTRDQLATIVFAGIESWAEFDASMRALSDVVGSSKALLAHDGKQVDQIAGVIRFVATPRLPMDQLYQEKAG